VELVGIGLNHSYQNYLGGTAVCQRRYDMRHEMLTQRALFCIDVMAKRVMLSQHFVTRVVPPLAVCSDLAK
jgi:hypothetical protein